MSERIANINLIHQAGLAGMESAICNKFGISEHEYHDNIIYSAMIQAGVQRFRVPGGLPQKLRKSDFLRYRVEERPFEDIHNLINSIENSLNYDPSSRKDNSEVFGLTWFLAELIYSLETKSSMVSVLPTPNLKNYAGKLSPNKISALNGLFQKVETIDLILPVAKLQIPTKDVEIFQEIIASDIFRNFSQSQSLIELSTEDVESTANNIIDKGKSLYNKFDSALDIKKTSLSLISVTTALIDTVCGKLPGSIADILGDTLSSALKEKRRITIYNYGDTHQKLLMEHYGAIGNKNRLG
jgi:hypothetical protein